MLGDSRGRRTRLWVAVVACFATGPLHAASFVDPRLGRWTVSGYVEAYGVWATDHDSRDQRPQGTAVTQITGDVHRAVRVFLDVRGLVGGPNEHAGRPGFANISDTFQDISPELEIPEGYVDLFLPSLDVRIGKQKFAWGKLDTFQPTDVLNPRRYTDPFVTEEQDAKIGVPALRLAYFPPALGRRWPTDTSLTFVWIPVPVPVRFPLAAERWFPTELLPRPHARLTVDADLDMDGGSTPVPIDLTSTLHTANAPPPQQLDEGAFALRAAGLAGSADWAVYWYDGAETAPAFDEEPVVRLRGPITPDRPVPIHADLNLRPRFGRIWLAGGDLAVPFGGFTARVEGAFGRHRLLPRSTSTFVQEGLAAFSAGPAGQKRVKNLVERLGDGDAVPVDLGSLFVSRDTVEWGLGVDYRWRGWMPVLQLNQTIVLDNHTELLVNDVDTRLFGVLRKTFFADRLASEVGVVQEFERGYTTALGRLTYALTDQWRVRLGYLLIAGTRNSRIGQYHHNDEAFLQVRYAY